MQLKHILEFFCSNFSFAIQKLTAMRKAAGKFLLKSFSYIHNHAHTHKHTQKVNGKFN